MRIDDYAKWLRTLVSEAVVQDVYKRQLLGDSIRLEGLGNEKIEMIGKCHEVVIILFAVFDWLPAFFFHLLFNL